MELIQGGGLCLCEEGASETSCLGFTCQVRKEVCACECVLIAVLFMHISRYRYPGQVEQSTLIV